MSVRGYNQTLIRRFIMIVASLVLVGVVVVAVFGKITQ